MKTIGTFLVATMLCAVTASAQMGSMMGQTPPPREQAGKTSQGYGHMGWGMGGYGHMDWGGHGHMGWGDHMGYGGHMMPWSSMMGPFGVWAGPETEATAREFLDETADLRRELHIKMFDLGEALRNPDGKKDEIRKMQSDVIDLKYKLAKEANKY